jgi:hypothetical protein
VNQEVQSGAAALADLLARLGSELEALGPEPAEERLLEALDERVTALRRQARDHFTAIVTARLERESWRPSAESEALVALREAVPDLFRLWLRDLAQEFDRRAHEALEPHRRRAKELVEAIRQAAADLFEVPYQPGELTAAVEAGREPYWITQQWSSFLKPIPAAWIDRVVPTARRQQRIRRRLAKQVEALVTRNGGSLRWAVQERLEEAFERFARALERQLDQVIAATHGALAAAAQRQRNEAKAVHGELLRLEPQIMKLDRLFQELQSWRAG